MQLTKQQVERLLKVECQFVVVSLGMLVTRLKNVYRSDSSQSVLDNCTNELNAFISKYKDILSADLAIMQKL